MRYFILLAALPWLWGCQGPAIGTFDCTDKGTRIQGELYGFRAGSYCDEDLYRYCIEAQGHNNYIEISIGGECTFNLTPPYKQKGKPPPSKESEAATVIREVKDLLNETGILDKSKWTKTEDSEVVVTVETRETPVTREVQPKSAPKPPPSKPEPEQPKKSNKKFGEGFGKGFGEDFTFSDDEDF